MKKFPFRKSSILTACLFAMYFLTAGTALAAENWKEHPYPAFAGGSGTAGDPWQIATPEQLALLAEKVNAGGDENAEYRIGHYILIDDIDLSAHEWTPIGLATYSSGSLLPVNDQSFGGVFDGNGHAIVGLRYRANTEAGVGLFGSVNGGWIKGVSLEADIRIADERAFARQAVGGLVGLLVGGIVESSDVHGVILGGTSTFASSSIMIQVYIGGVVGYARDGSHILASLNGAAVTGFFDTVPSIGSGQYVGGIVGRSLGEISNCVNSGTVTGGAIRGPSGTRELNAGGIVGNLFPGVAEISYCVNNGTVTGGASDGTAFAGGIAGNAYRSTISFSLNNGSVDGGSAVNNSSTSAGGIAGINYAGQNVTILDSANTGTITGGAALGNNYIGGIVGNNDAGTLTNTYNYSDVLAKPGTTAIAGGITGRNMKTIVSSYWNSERTVAGNQGTGSGSGTGATPLSANAFMSPSVFSGWSISDTPGIPGDRDWFYPTYDPTRPHLAHFFDSAGQPLVRTAPNTTVFDVARNGGRNLTLAVGDGLVSISGGQFAGNPYSIDGMNFSTAAGGILLQYTDGTVAGTAAGSIGYTLDGRAVGLPSATFGISVLPSLTIGAQSKTVQQGDVLSSFNPLLLPLTALGGTPVFRIPSIDPRSGLEATVTGGGANLSLTGKAGEPDLYPVDAPATINGLQAEASGTVTILPADTPTSADIAILSLNPPVAAMNTSTSFTAIASRSVGSAALDVTWPDGSTQNVSVATSGRVLSFALTPAQAGLATLTFTMSDPGGATSTDSVELAIRENGGVVVLALEPPVATVNVATSFTALLSRPATGATLRATWPDGSSRNVPVTASGSTLSFAFTPDRAGIVVLTFTIAEANGSVSLDSVNLAVRGVDGIRVLNLTPPSAVVNVPTSFTATTDRPANGAILHVTWSDGSGRNVSVTISGNVLSFTLTPEQVGPALLSFTLTGFDGSVSPDSVNLAVRRVDGIRVSNLTPSSAVVNVSTSFTATTDRPANSAALRATWPDGSSRNVPVTVSGNVLSFTFAPEQIGQAVLTFTFTGFDGSVSLDALRLTVREKAPQSDLIEAVTISPEAPYSVGQDLLIEAKLTRASGIVTMSVDTPRGTTETLIVEQNGDTAAAHFVPDRKGTYRLIVRASDGDDTAAAARTFRVTRDGTARRGGGGGGCDSAGFGVFLLWLALPILLQLSGKKGPKK